MSSHASTYTFVTPIAIYYASHGHETAELLTGRCSHAAGSVVVVSHVLLLLAAACELIAANSDGASTVDRLGTLAWRT